MNRSDNPSTFIISGPLGLTTAVGQAGAYNPGAGRGRRGGGPSEEPATMIAAPSNSRTHGSVPMARTALAVVALTVFFLGWPMHVRSVVTVVSSSVAMN